MLRMDRVHVIRHKVLMEGFSIRRLARQPGVSRQVVRSHLATSQPVRRETGPRPRPVLARIARRISAIAQAMEFAREGKLMYHCPPAFRLMSWTLVG